MLRSSTALNPSPLEPGQQVVAGWRPITATVIDTYNAGAADGLNLLAALLRLDDGTLVRVLVRELEQVAAPFQPELGPDEPEAAA